MPSFMFKIVIAILMVPLFARADLSSDVAAAIVPLIPQDAQGYEVQSDSNDGKLLDEAVYKILSTPSGKALCGATPEDFTVFQKNFFLGKSYAKKAFTSCKGHFYTGKVYSNFRNYPKKYVIIKSAREMVADGWTTPYNETILFLSTQDSSQQRVIRTLIHEMALANDSKENLGYFGLFDAPAFGVTTKNNPNICQVIPLLRRGEIKHSLNALRAFEMEKRISKELGLFLPNGFADWQGISCSDRLKFMQPYVKKLDYIIGSEDFADPLINLCEDAKTTVQIEFNEAIAILEKFELRFDNSQTRSICDFMSEGWPYTSRAINGPRPFFRGGPGPRIGGAGWKDLQKKKEAGRSQSE